ncbi:hypothetical protein [Pseudomonas wadenswilerensis]|uniref:Uncharacterized protein n=1 Tax=Pseudomonas wadenswilerensis TaxID=1785161 RepID=A0A380T595_9PSED|nr:hypothetical protein [Pseudomonas wadenswilerensis]SUQ64770.1 hypothetical protein CCOS864_04236 [Pseudomonas wadenswilerensis]
MSVDILKLKTLAEATKRDQYDCLALNNYGMAVPPAVVLELISEIERHRQVEAEGGKPDLNTPLLDLTHSQVLAEAAASVARSANGARTPSGNPTWPTWPQRNFSSDNDCTPLDKAENVL